MDKFLNLYDKIRDWLWIILSACMIVWNIWMIQTFLMKEKYGPIFVEVFFILMWLFIVKLSIENIVKGGKENGTEGNVGDASDGDVSG